MIVEDFASWKKSSSTTPKKTVRRVTKPKPKPKPKPAPKKTTVKRTTTKRTTTPKKTTTPKRTTTTRKANPAGQRSKTGTTTTKRTTSQPATTTTRRTVKRNPAEQSARIGSTPTSRAVARANAPKSRWVPSKIKPDYRDRVNFRSIPGVQSRKSQQQDMLIDAASLDPHGRGVPYVKPRLDAGYFPKSADIGSLLTSPDGQDIYFDPSIPEMTQATRIITHPVTGEVIGTSETDAANRGFEAMLDQADIWAQIDAGSFDTIHRGQRSDGGEEVTEEEGETVTDPVTGTVYYDDGGGWGGGGGIPLGMDVGGPGLPGVVGNPLENFANAGFIPPDVMMLLRQRALQRQADEEEWLEQILGGA